MKRQAVQKILAGLVVTLSVTFAVLATVYQQQQVKGQETTKQKIKQINGQQQQVKQQAQSNEQLINDQAYQKRTLDFLNRALDRATASGDLTETDERYGNEDAYEAVAGMAGMNSALKLKNHDLHFNKMASGEIVGDGQIEIEASGISDDKKAKTRHPNYFS
ncbi:hypothetical protein ACEF14_04315 [Weissella paramesenteroides]